MVAVVPSAPKHQAPQNARSPKPAAGGANFGRFLEQATGEQHPAPEAAREERPPTLEQAPEDRAPEPEPIPEDRAPAAEPEAAPPAEEAGLTLAAEPKATYQNQEELPTGAKDPQSAPAPAAPQPFVPLVPLVPTTAAETLSTAAALQHSLPAPTLPAPTLPAPAPATRALNTLAPTGTQRAPRQPEDRGSGLLPLDQLPEEQQLDLDSLLPKPPSPAGGQHSSADLLSFDELMRPDLRTEVSPEPVLDQLQQAMNTALLDETTLMPQVVRGLATLVSGGMSEMRLQLMPEDLGEIEVRVRTSEGVVRGEMLVQNPEVKQLLDQHLDRLRNALHQQGLDLRDFDIGLAPEGRFGQPDRSWHGFQPQGGTRRQTAATSALPEAPTPAPRGSLAVDYLA